LTRSCRDHMIFFSHAFQFKKAPEYLPLIRIWVLEDSELAPLGLQVTKRIDSPDFPDKELRRTVCWTGAAILEFQDLQAITFPQTGRFFNINYLFFEALSAMRESVVTGLNGQIHASLSVLRSAMELFMFHYWWKERLWTANSYEGFYEWLEGRKAAPPFANIVSELFSASSVLSLSPSESDVKTLYAHLCSYAHKPLIKEAVTTLRGGNFRDVTDNELLYWMNLLSETQHVLLDLAIRKNPESLFPVELHRKFGFNPPLGVFFDHQNFVSIKAALGDEAIAVYRRSFQNQDPPKATIE